MSIPLGQTPYDGTGAVTPGQPTTVEGETTVTTGTPLPRTEQPIQDQITPVGVSPTQTTIVYAASAQGPLLPKPLEPKQDKKVEKEGSGTADPTQSQDGNTVQVDGEHKAHHEQQDEGGGQGGGGTGGGKSGSDSGGSGSFTGGGDSNSRRESSGAIQVDGSLETAATADVNAVAASGDADSIQTQENAYLDELDPTGVAKVSESGLYSPPVNGAQFFENAGKIMQEIVNFSMKFMEQVPDGPIKMRFMDFLKVVQDALNQFQQLLRELQLNDSKGAKERSQAQLETSLEKIEEQRKQMDEMAKKSDEAAKKAKILGPLAIIFAFLLAILLIVLMTLFLPLLIMTMPPLGAMIVPLIVAEFLDQCAKAVGKKPFAIEAIATAIMTVIDRIVSAFNKSVGGSEETENNLKAGFKIATVAIIMAVSTALAPGYMLFGGSTTLLSFLSASHAVKAGAMADGMDETEADKVEMYVGMAVGVVYAVAALAVAWYLPMGGAADAVANFVKTFAQQAAEAIRRAIAMTQVIGDKVAEFIGKVAQALIKEIMNPETWVQVTGLGLQTTNAVATYNQQRILADIALIQGEMDSDIELKDQTIQILKKMIKQLLDGLNGISDDIAGVTRSLKKTHAGVSQITGDLFG